MLTIKLPVVNCTSPMYSLQTTALVFAPLLSGGRDLESGVVSTSTNVPPMPEATTTNFVVAVTALVTKFSVRPMYASLHQNYFVCVVDHSVCNLLMRIELVMLHTIDMGEVISKKYTSLNEKSRTYVHFLKTTSPPCFGASSCTGAATPT